MKMPSPFGIISVHGDQLAARRREGRPTPGYSMIIEVMVTKSQDNDANKKEGRRAKQIKKDIKTTLSASDLEKIVKIGANLEKPEAEELTSFLIEHRDVFAWSASGLQGVS